MKKKALNIFKAINEMPGQTWVNIWSAVALVKFVLGKPIDPVFLGVIGFYVAHKIGNRMTSEGQQPNE